MHYFDSSLIVSLFSNEARTPELLDWFSSLDPDRLMLSEWTLTEFQSAMSLKRRTSQLSSSQREQAEKLFRFYVGNFFRTLGVTSAEFRRAAEIAGREDINIRAGDALHLAIAEAVGAMICTLDIKMHRTASALGIRSLLP